ncbi:MAG: hypothetical protein RIB71_15295 [Imperialibacter sp.]|uniref:hypothetical protein n=1 Tax=Imperialibacter sp. TaxID=2038411 RepID=UPI0032EC77D4
MTEEKKKWRNLTRKDKVKIVSIFAAIISIGLIGMAYKQFMRFQPQDYTIGTVTKIWKPVKGGTKVAYVYFADGQEQYGNVDLFGFEQVAKPGRRFLVSYPEQYVWEGVMDLSVEMPDSLPLPADGWDERPQFLK